MSKENPLVDLDKTKEIGLYHLFTLNGNLLVVAFDVRDGKFLGMLLTRPPEASEWEGTKLKVYQVTRSGVILKGLGPLLYAYTMLVLEDTWPGDVLSGGSSPLGVLLPDDEVSDDAARVWRKFYFDGWALGQGEILSEYYVYNGKEHLTLQLQDAARRGTTYIEQLRLAPTDVPWSTSAPSNFELERFLMDKSFSVYHAAHHKSAQEKKAKLLR